MTAITTPGVYHAYPEADYHADPALSYSSAKLLLGPAGPARYHWQQTHPDEEQAEKKFDEGRAAHRLVLGDGPDLVDVGDDPWAGTHKTEVQEVRATGALPLKTATLQKVRDMADALTANPEAARLLTEPGTSELSIWQTDQRTGRLIRGRIDRATTAHLVDYKTVAVEGGAEPARWIARHALDHRYYLQAAWYEQLDQLFGRPLVFVVQERRPPYPVSVVRLPASYMVRGAEEMRAAIDLWDRCLTADDWPGYPARTVTPDPPPWFSPDPDTYHLTDPSEEPHDDYDY